MSKPVHLDRRTLLQALGLGLAGASLTSCKGHHEDEFALPKPPVPGADAVREHDEKWVATACAQCPAGCGVRVRVVGGRAVKIEGAPDNPINRGGIGPRGLAGLQVLYDPDRIKQPLRRKGARGSASFEPVTWDDAIALVSERLTRLREAGEPHRLGITCGRDRGTLLENWQRFAQAYGTPNVFDGLSRRLGAVAQAATLTQGFHEIPAYDWSSTRYVLSVGAGIMEASCQAVYFSRAAAYLRQGRPGARAKIVQVEPSRSRTAAQADEWIAIRPGTHAAFVLGIAHVLVRDGKHDADFVRDHAFGFEPWTDRLGQSRPGFKDLLAAECSPEATAATCGVKASVIERIAAELAEQRPAVAIADERATLTSNGLQIALACQALNALLGSIDRPGGVLVQRPVPLPAREPITPDETAAKGLAMPRLDGVGASRYPFARSCVEALPEALVSGAPYGLDTLLLHQHDPLYSGLGTKRWREAVGKVPFVVSFSPFMDETTAAMADLVLPDHTYLERWEDAAPAPSGGVPVFGVRQPAVMPLHDTRGTGDVLLQLAKAMGEPVAAALPWESVEAQVKSDLDALQALGRGSTKSDSTRTFRREVLKGGFWADDGYPFENWAEAFRTPSGKFEFFSQAMWRRLEELSTTGGMELPSLLASWGATSDPVRACQPHFDEPQWAGDPAEFPFVLEPYKAGTYAEGSGANQPLLQEIVTERGKKPWRTQVELAPETAAKLGIRTGDMVEIRSPIGAARGPALAREGIHPDVVRVQRGGGHTEMGRWAKGWGFNVMELLVPVMDPFGGFPALLNTRVSVRRIES